MDDVLAWMDDGRKKAPSVFDNKVLVTLLGPQTIDFLFNLSDLLGLVAT